jgi:DnaJ-domain-containing protein 1
MINYEKLYKILELPVGASVEEIKKARKRLALKYHPDLGTKNEEKMIQINDACDKLIKHRNSLRDILFEMELEDMRCEYLLELEAWMACQIFLVICLVMVIGALFSNFTFGICGFSVWLGAFCFFYKRKPDDGDLKKFYSDIRAGKKY